MNKVLLTGATGFLGSHLLEALLRQGDKVTILKRSTSDTWRINYVLGDVEAFDVDTQSVEDVFKADEFDVVIHTACSYGRDGESYVELLDANVRFGLNIVQGLLASKKPVTFINTGTVLAPAVSPYALSKHQFSQWGRVASTQSAGILRFINVLLQHMYGPGDNASKFSTHVMHACHRNDHELQLTAGEQKRDFIYIEDVVNAYMTLVDRRDELEPLLDVEVGTGVSPTVREFVETVHRLTDSKTQLRFGALQYRTNEAMHCKADITRMRKLAWCPQYDLNAGLKKTLELEFKP